MVVDAGVAAAASAIDLRASTEAHQRLRMEASLARRLDLRELEEARH